MLKKISKLGMAAQAFKRAAAIVLSACLFAVGLPQINSAYAADDVIDFEDGLVGAFVCSPGSGVQVREERDGKYLNISPQSDGTAAYARYALEVSKEVPTKITYHFRINDYDNNENVIADISQGGSKIFEIKMNGGQLWRTDKYGRTVSCGRGAVVNRWYKAELTVDFSEGTYTAAVDGETIADSESIMNTIAAGIEPIYITFSSKYAPGIAIDNFYAENIQKLSSIEISGAAVKRIADGKSGSEVYNVAVLDARGAVISNAALTASILPAEGASTSVSENTVTVSFDEQAEAQNYTLYVSSGGKTVSKRIKLERYAPQAASIKISGDSRLCSFTEERNKYQYTASVYDGDGVLMPDETVVWSLQGENIPSTVSLDSETGVISVSGELPKDEHILLRAELSGNDRISAVKKLTLQDTRTYISDMARLNALMDYMNKVLDIGEDKKNGSPLIPWVLNRYTMEPAVWTLPDGEIVPCDLASMGNFFRTGEIIEKLTGNKRFTDHMYKLNQFYIDNYWNEEPGLFIWGGHTTVNYDDLTAHFGYGNRIQELKSHGAYMSPLFELNPRIARKETISTWEHLVEKNGWKTMTFNRHALHSEPYTENDWLNVNNGYVEPDLTRGYSPNMSTSISFFTTEADMLYFAADLYRHTTDPKEKERVRTWIIRLKKSFWACSDPNTQFYAYQNTSAGMPSLGKEYGAPGTKNPNEIFPEWWKMSQLPSGITNATYGDRFYNQYAEDLIDQGYVEDTIENRTKLMESCVKFTYSPENQMPFADWYAAEALGLDTEEGAAIWQRAMHAMGNVVKYGYDEDTNQLHYMLADGTRITGLVSTRPGYYGNAGKVFKSQTPGPGTVYPYAFVYAKSLTIPKSARSATYDEDLANIYKFVRGGMRGLGCGEIGIDFLGDRAELERPNGQLKYTQLLSAMHLYEASHDTRFLDLARVMTSDMLKERMVDGLLSDQPDARYTYLYGAPSQYAWVMAYLEALILGEEENLPYMIPYSGYYEDYGWYGDNEVHMSSVSSGTMWGTAYTKVAAQRIDVPQSEITMKAGETKMLDYVVEPDDAASKGIIIASDNTQCVQTGYESAMVTAIAPGTATVTFRLSSNRGIQTKVKITVTE